VKCAAFGCRKAPGKNNGLFCRGCWSRLPVDLRGPAAVQQAIVWLGKKDGYIASIDTSPRIKDL
jgi:hypothetical protein